MIYCEDPRRFSSRVIGFSFQGPRGRTFLPSGSRCLVSLVFAVKDFVRLSFHRGFRCGPLVFCSGFLAEVRGVGGPKRVAVSSLRRLCCQRLCETFFRDSRYELFLCRALRRGVGAVRSGRRCMLPLTPCRQVLLSLSVVFQKLRSFMGFRSKRTRLLYSDRPIGRLFMRVIGSLCLLAVLVLLGAAAPNTVAVPPLTACGVPGKGPCPLQGWMRDELARPYARRSFDELALNARALAGFNPDPTEWRDWGDFAQQAARAAEAHDEVHVLQACTRCHHSYRHEYVEKYRARAVGGAH